MTILNWRIHRTLIDKLEFLHPFSSQHKRKRLLFISVSGQIATTQLFPVFFHGSDYPDIELRELPLHRFLNGSHPYKTSVDAVCFQTWFDLKPEELKSLTQNIQNTWQDANIAYFDWFAPTDLRYAEALNKDVVIYVKKQLLRDFNQYNQVTLGDTNLSNYYSRYFNLEKPEICFSVPENFREKLFLGTHFAFSDYMLPYFMGKFPLNKNRSIDLHARIAVKGSDWYSLMRQQALDKVRNLNGQLQVMFNGKVSRKKFIKELFNAKLCFSPFGYGEVCWRDFEAMFTGSLLLKPDMSHIDCYPQIFFPYETYVPLNWDLSDFNEKIDYYLNNAEEREIITRNAFNLLNNYFHKKSFLYHACELFKRLELINV